MSYADRAKKARESGSVKRISQDFRKLKEGETLLGKFLGRELIKSTKPKMPDFYRYHFDTDEGPIGTTFGQVFDAREGLALEPGALYEIESKGQRDIGAGKKVNVYVVSLLELPTEAEAQELDLTENDTD